MPFTTKCIGFNPKKIYMFGEEGSGLEPRGSLQNYEQLKQSCLQAKILFEDPQFIPSQIDLGLDGKNIQIQDVEWMRPTEISEAPQFLSEEKRRFDVNQGELGNCWFLAALTDVAQNPQLLARVVPQDQSFGQDYCGIFHFRFWQYGRWIDIVIDDRLAASKNGQWQLVFTRARDENAFWTPLLEKAYAKLYGSYANLKGGMSSESLSDLTGGLNEKFRADSTHWKDNIFYIMKDGFAKKSFLACAAVFDKPADHNLMRSHTYSITGLDEVNTNLCETVKLVRIRNPWGGTEWTGKWSDKSDQWNAISDRIKKDLLIVQEDGEFWMDFQDFMTHFDWLELCYPCGDMKIHDWNIFMVDGAWNTPGSSLDTPFIITVNGGNVPQNILKIGVIQKNKRIHNQEELPIGFKILTLQAQEVFSFPATEYERVTGHVILPNGEYHLLPFARGLGGKHREYLLRIYCTGEIDVRLSNESEVV
ncbi:hypothetical protein JTB14_034233 [Gonioctena quinquepunctata]|nr:hypothetical protein JTB14_034233 [Gonioctena quinquepunctata]